MKILVVDDDVVFLELVLNMLSSLGYDDIHFCISAEEALRAIKEEQRPFECFLLDIQMYEMDGIKLCTRIRASRQYRTTPIIMLTAMTEKHFVDRAFQAGANDYVTKPIERVDIKARMGMVEAILSERNHSACVSQRLETAENAYGTRIRLEDPLVFDSAAWLVPLQSLENYVLRLGNMRLVAARVYGFHIKNGPQIFASASGVEFTDMLTDVAVTIRDTVGAKTSFLSYVGCGDFCAIIPKSAHFDPSFGQFQINEALEVLFEASEEQAWDLPELRVGKGQSNGLLSFRDPTHMIYSAVMDARRWNDREFSGLTRWHVESQDGAF